MQGSFRLHASWSYKFLQERPCRRPQKSKNNLTFKDWIPPTTKKPPITFERVVRQRRAVAQWIPEKKLVEWKCSLKRPQVTPAAPAAKNALSPQMSSILKCCSLLTLLHFFRVWGKGVKSPKNGIDSANLPPAHGTKTYPSLLGSPIDKG